ncbi:hypothetical protein Tco_1496146, partial [Tanacetum coccineum]
ASSLGLNRIKTRSGPLPQESFLGFGGGSGNVKSNLSKAKNGNDKKKTVVDNVDGVNKSGSLPLGRSPLRNGESSSSEAGRIKSRGYSGNLRSSELCTPEMKTSYDCENPKESESPRFQAIMRVTSAPRKRYPNDIKSFSHELNSKGVRPFPLWKPRGLNNVEVHIQILILQVDKWAGLEG